MLQKIDECRKYKEAFSDLPVNSYLTAFVFKAKRKCCIFCLHFLFQPHWGAPELQIQCYTRLFSVCTLFNSFQHYITMKAASLSC